MRDAPPRWPRSPLRSPPQHAHCARVLLQVYELGKGSKLADAIKSLNSFTQSTLGAGGVFHVAVEVEGVFEIA